MLQCVTIFLVTARKVRLCVVCGSPLEKPSRGRMPRFCGVACRMAAYRRRRQKLSEKMPRWEGPQGRLRLSRLRTFEREQIARLAWEQQREERRRVQAEQPAASGKGWERPPTAAELDAMSEHQLRAMVPEKPDPLPEDWMYLPLTR